MEEFEHTQHSNIEEAEMGQLQALHLNMNALAAHRAKMEAKALLPSLSECEMCGDDIPEARQEAVAGCTTCVICQTKRERK